MTTFRGRATTNIFQVRDLEEFNTNLLRHGFSLSLHRYLAEDGDLAVQSRDPFHPDGHVSLEMVGIPFSSLLGDSAVVRAIAGMRGVACVSYEPLSKESIPSGVEYDEKGLPCDACSLPQDAHSEERLDPAKFYCADLPALVSRHLVEGEVAIFTTVDTPDLGVSEAINSTGERRKVDLSDIFDLANELRA